MVNLIMATALLSESPENIHRYLPIALFTKCAPTADFMRNFLFQFLGIIRPSLTRRFLYGYFYNFVCDFFAIKEGYVLLESHHGKNFGGNPYYLAAHLASDPQYRHLHLIMVGPPRRARWLRQRLHSPSITVVKPRSLRYAFYLATSKWLISDVTFPMYFRRRADQKYLNTWHGTPLKTLGRHAEFDAARHLVNIQRNFFHADLILAPNYHTEKILLSAYSLDYPYKERMLRLGYPRNDPFCRGAGGGKSRSSHEVHIGFMPTWRGGLSDRSLGSKQQLIDLTNLFIQLDSLLPSFVTLWIKLHPLVSGKILLSHYRLLKPFPQDIEAYEHLATCDALITDYSSVFFDFAATRRPIFRYISDEGGYEAERGFCLDPSSLPFPCARTPAELVALIREEFDHPKAALSESYTNFLETFNPLDLGTSAQEVSRAFFDIGLRNVECQKSPARAIRRVALYVGKPALPPATYAELLEKFDTANHSFTLLIESEVITPEWEIFLKEIDPAFLYIAIQFHAYVAPSEFFALVWGCISKNECRPDGKTWKNIGVREGRRLLGDVELDDFISLDGESIGSRLIESSRAWRQNFRLSTDDIKSGRMGSAVELQEYYRERK